MILFLLFKSADAVEPVSACGAADAMSISEFAHRSNADFITKASAGALREFSPAASANPAVIDFATGQLHAVNVGGGEKFLSYHSDNGWNNQVLNLLAALDMAHLANRTLIVPPFQWPRRRGDAKISVCRLVDIGSLATALGGVRVLCEDEAGSVQAALSGAGVEMAMVRGEGQPHRKRGLPRWTRIGWTNQIAVEGVVGIVVTCCLFWTWRLPDDVARSLYGAFRYHPTLEGAARRAAAALRDGAHAAMHVRRGDKASVDSAYTGIFGGKMSPDFFLRLLREEGITPGELVYVATDELDRSWFEPLRAAGYALRFVDDLPPRPLLEALSAFPQALWADVLAILEQIICIHAPGGFVGSLPSTLSGFVVNARASKTASYDVDACGHPTGVALGVAAPADPRPLFFKTHESCCDARTALDMLKLPGVRSLADVPCVNATGKDWC